MGQARRGHGKVILLGEHSVVYGRPALAAGLARGATARARDADRTELVIEPWGVRLSLESEAEQDTEGHATLRGAFRALLDGYPQRPPLRIEAQVEIPGSAGLGGSAALAVAIIRALDEKLGLERDDRGVAELALAAERVSHGNPSGIDNAMAAHGGLALYRRGEGLTGLRARRRLPLVLGHSGQAGKTKATVASVARQHAERPDKLEQIFDAIEAIVNNGKTALEHGELARFGQLMDLNQKLLAGMLVSTTRLEEMCRAAKEAGALGAKLTGGGGGGCMIALCADRASAEGVQQALASQGREAFFTEAG